MADVSVDALLRALPLAAYRPLRQAVTSLGRRNPLRMAATLVLKRALHANRDHLANRLTEIRPLDAPHLTFEPIDSMVIDAVYWFGVRGYEGTVARVWAALCRQSHAVLEIGGNVGVFTVVGGSVATGSYTVVEPVPRVADMLRRNLQRNNITAVRVLQAAAVPGETPQTVSLNLPDEGRDMPVGAHLVHNVEVEFRASHSLITVEGLPVRDLARGCDLIKIDAEGIEAALLGDIRAMLVETRPSLLIEVLPEAETLGAFLAALAAQAGYLIHILPEYGSDTIITVSPEQFTSRLPREYHSKDVVLSVAAIA
jgi:FkbM family methyltransferase